MSKNSSLRYWEIIARITLILNGICLVFSIAMCVVGMIAYNRIGAYPRIRDMEDLFDAFKNTFTEDWDYGPIHYCVDSAFDYMMQTLYVPVITLFINLILSLVINTNESIFHLIVPAVSVVVYFVFAVLCSLGIIEQTDITMIIISVGFLVLLALLIFFLKGTDGGMMMLFTLIAFGIHFLLIPLIMWLFTGGFKQILSALGIVVLGGLVFFGISGASGTSGSSGTNGGIDRERKKIMDRISTLNTNIDNRGRALDKHRNKEFGYGHIDEKAVHNKISSELDEKKALLKQLDKMDKKDKD